MSNSRDISDMSPKSDKNGSSKPNEDCSDQDDLQEIASVNNSLDELSNMLDAMENNTDNIMAQLRELLQSNREIRAEFKNLEEPNTKQCEIQDQNRNQQQASTIESSTSSNQDEEMKEN